MGEPFHLAPATRAALLAAAHEAIGQAVLGPEPRREAASAANGDDWLPPDAAGVFVSVHVDGELRGCLGTFSLDRSLPRSVRRMAAEAATQDARFRPLGEDEVAQAEVEISLLGPPRPAWSRVRWKLGEQGLTVSRGTARGLLLPQVALTHHLDRRGFLEATCEKAGLEGDAWKDPRTEVLAFDAEVFGDQSDDQSRFPSHRA